MALDIGIHTGPQNATYEDLRRVWHLADTSGFYWVSIWDHFFENPTVDARQSCFEAVSILTALAAETTNVRVGALVFCMAFRNPALLAKAATTIDHVSKGRLELGLGAGWYQLEHESNGVPFRPVGERMDVLEEGVQIIKAMLTQGSATFQGKYFQVEDAHCYPRPLQDRPRIWVGGQGEKRTLRIVARYADGWNVPYISPQVYRHKVHVLDDWCEKEDRDPAGITRTVNAGFYMGADQQSADRLRNGFDQTWGPLADDRRGGMLFGTASEVIDGIGAYVDAGAQGVNIALRAPFDWEALQVFVEEVMPAFV